MSAILRRPKLRFIVPFVFLIVVLLYVVSLNRYQIQNTLSYATRPLWDQAETPNRIIPHYYSDGMPIDSYMCALHGWKARSHPENVRVLDAVLMSSELDLLDIRMHELESVVDQFFIVESNGTFTGLPKERYYADNQAKFVQFVKKINYTFLPGYALQAGQTAWDIESKTRDTMTQALRSYIAEIKPDIEVLVIMSDVDEIPSSHTIKLLKHCDFGRSVHLQMRDYIYSYEWFSGFTSWRASVQLWGPGSFYRHSKSTETILADSGWHCSFCFRTIPEYIVKMKGFSHSDRIGGRINLLDPKRIQEIVCKGKDIFGMLPEAYSYPELISRLKLLPQTTAVNLPKYLLMNAEKFKFLLPGGCKRDIAADSSPSTHTA